MKKMLISMLVMLMALPTIAQENNDHDFKVAKNMDVFNAIYKNLDLMYVDTLDADEVIGNGIKAMLGSLDPYTTYYPESEQQELKRMLTGKYAGVGALIRYNNQLQKVVIDEPYDNMPAAEAGLKKGDIILTIADTSMVGKDVAYVSDHLRGEPGTSFVIKIKRPSQYKTPFIIWANYDIPEQDGIDISANYLGALLLETAGIPGNSFFNFLTKQMKAYPVITVNGYKDNKGNAFQWSGEGTEFLDYRILQYYELFD